MAQKEIKQQKSFVVLSIPSTPQYDRGQQIQAPKRQYNNLSPLKQHPPSNNNLRKEMDKAALRNTRLRQPSGAPPGCPLPPNPPTRKPRERVRERERTGGLRQRLRSRSRSRARLQPSLSYHANLNRAEIIAYQNWVVSANIVHMAY